ncbi:MAG: T9SS type A sorting domain-containing protein [Sphingobacteriales bacterium JAD_PAG50586_3]|nr:MAG: T9SS type A sorting domain-containing protein [Sphingobacteriales bacterium JAD_PAG50586_3]
MRIYLLKTIQVFILVCCSNAILTAQLYNDPNFNKPTTGYGSDGPHTTATEEFENPYYAGQNIKIYHPGDIQVKVPTLFYSHAYGGYIPLHVIGLFNFIAKKGYAIVFVPYQTTGVSVENRYENLLAGFRKAARDFPNIIDTTRVGFMGHSFGGGASFATAYRCFTENNWGQNGRFIHSSAPWYSYNISQAEMQSFPIDTKLIVEVYDDDVVNDHRMAADVFTAINIPVAEKDFIKVKTDTVNNYVYATGHDLPTTYAGFDALDYYAYYRLIDALCDYTFTGSLVAKDVALGNGSLNQITMPTGMQNLEQTDMPIVTYDESRYGFPCSAAGNPRNAYCGNFTGVSMVETGNVSIYPNPFTTGITISNLIGNEMFLLQNSVGQIVYSGNVTGLQHLNSLPNGLYILKTIAPAYSKTYKLFKE